MGLFNGMLSGGDRDGKKEYPQSFMLFLRIAIGGYFLYLDYGLWSDRANGTLPVFVLYFILLIFGIVGVGLIILSLKAMAKGEYQGGMADVDGKDISSNSEDEENIKK